MKYSIILMDIDDTLIDFEPSERYAIERTLRECGAPHDKAACDIYRAINSEYWERLERGEIEKKVMLERRFDDTFAALGLPPCNSAAVNRVYLHNISMHAELIDGAIELLNELKAMGCRVYFVTNGTKMAQTNRLLITGLDKLCDGIFISEEVGFEKPAREYFEAVFKSIGSPPKSETIILGDSMTSDIRGGEIFGIATCLFNPKGKEHKGTTPGYEITRLCDFMKIAEGE